MSKTLEGKFCEHFYQMQGHFRKLFEGGLEKLLGLGPQTIFIGLWIHLPFLSISEETFRKERISKAAVHFHLFIAFFPFIFSKSEFPSAKLKEVMDLSSFCQRIFYPHFRH